MLTIASTVLIGRRKWHGWIVAAVNSLIICVIGLRTAQTGFIPANLFCLALYGYNIFQWRYGNPAPSQASAGIAQADVRQLSEIQAPVLATVDQSLARRIAHRPRATATLRPAPRLSSETVRTHARRRSSRRNSLPEIRN